VHVRAERAIGEATPRLPDAGVAGA